MAYNIPGLENLVLTREQIVGIYNGTYTHWNDTTFHKYNPNSHFPNASIIPVARYFTSGSTEIFTHALSSFSSSWNNTFGVFTDRTAWNSSVVTTFGQRMDGMVDTINAMPYSIGYATPSSADATFLPYASVVNRFGNVASGRDLNAIQAAMNEFDAQLTPRLTNMLVDAWDPSAYPIVGFSYILIHRNMPDCQTAVSLSRYMTWFTFSEQAHNYLIMNRMIPVTTNVASKIQTTVLDQITCNGIRVADLVLNQEYAEAEALKTWKISVEISVPVVFVLMAGLIVYILRQKLIYLKMLDRDEWDIRFYEIEFNVPKGHSRRATEPMEQQRLDPEVLAGVVSASFSGKHKGVDVTIRKLNITDKFDINRNFRQCLMRMRELVNHQNVGQFFGLTLTNQQLYLVEEFCEKGQLSDLLRNSKFNLTDSFKYAVAVDISRGMAYLHKHNIVNGCLRMSSCLIDSRWTVKIVGWEYATMYEIIRKSKVEKSRFDKSKSLLYMFFKQLYDATQDVKSDHEFWTPPEVLKYKHLGEPTKAGDVFNFGLIFSKFS